MNKKRVYILSNGCHESYMDAAVVDQYFGIKGDFLRASNLEEADLILLLGCAVMQAKEEQTRELIRLIEERKRPEAKFVVAGCISKVRPELASQDQDSLSLHQRIDDLLTMKTKDEGITANFPYKPYRKDQKDLLTAVKLDGRQKKLYDSMSSAQGLLGFISTTVSGPAAWILGKYHDFIDRRIDVWGDGTYTIKISTGCCGACSYCSIKQSRGQIRSRPSEEIAEDFKKGLTQGYTDFALIGTDIGDYGRDRGENLLDLLQTLVKLEGSFDIRLRNVNPRWLIPFTPQLCELLASGKISYIQSPIQSCSDNVLKLMNRGYRAGDFLEAVRKIRSACPRIFIKTQAIVGFPGETEHDFLDNMKLYKSKLFNYVEVFAYSDRPNTKAEALPNHLSNKAVQARRRKLLYKSMFCQAPKQLLKKWLLLRRCVTSLDLS